jgi:hypothetical protein
MAILEIEKLVAWEGGGLGFNLFPSYPVAVL